MGGSQPLPGGGADGGRWSLEVRSRSDAPVGLLWPLVGEAARWKEWSWMTRTFLLREGQPAPDGVGALRRFAVGPGGSIEEVVAWEPPHHLGYVTVKGLPVRNYRADVYLQPDGSGTTVRWRSTFDPLLPGTGRPMRFLLRRVVGGFARRVCRYGDRLQRTVPDR